MYIIKIRDKGKKPTVGDIFVMQFNNGSYLFGRTISTVAKLGSIDRLNLIYIYNALSNYKTQIPNLDKIFLLVPPIITNNLPWTRGYFEVIKNLPLSKDDVLEQHCFRSYTSGYYYDEQTNRLDKEYKPCGVFGLDSFMTIDYHVSKALGLDLSDYKQEIRFRPRH